ncbi:MAG: Fic family protein [Lachnospiraceae bacterium]|nr:Fic family protein [Lachnospiraceae bacterium]
MKYHLSSIIEEYERLGIRQQLDYDKFYLYSIITHSTAIEGSTVTEIENRLLFDEGISANKPMPEQLMNLDLKAAYERGFAMAKKHTAYSVAMLCRLAALVMKNTGSDYKTIAGDFSSAKGDLRKVNVSAGRGGKSYLSWQKIRDRLEEFCRWLNSERKSIGKKDLQGIYELSFEAHYRIATIHPWADGNGRMSRLVMNMIQREADVVPSVVKKNKRADYIKTISRSQEKEESSGFLSFMLRHHCENLLQEIKEYKTSVNNEGGQKQRVVRKGGQKQKGGQKRWSETTARVYEIISEKPAITRKELSTELGVNPSAVQKHIARLKEEGAIERVGGARGGYWKIL